MAKPIPISAAQAIAVAFDYDQVVVMARKVGIDGIEHVTTYGVDPTHCEVAKRMGEVLKYKIMGWENPDKNDSESRPAHDPSAETGGEVERD